MTPETREVMFSSKTDQHATPRAFAVEQVKRWNITLDVCADEHNTVAPTWIEEDSLDPDVSWDPGTGAAWMNPPYGKGEEVCPPDCKKKTCIKRGSHCLQRIPGIDEWVEKAATCGYRVVCLLPARTDTKWWHKWIWEEDNWSAREGVDVTFVSGRLNFNEAESGAPFPSVLVIFNS